MYKDVAFIVPARIGSTRLPRKALLKIGNKTLIEHVISQILPITNENLYIATDSEEIALVSKSAGAKPIMTSPNCPTGSDRIYEAFGKINNTNNIEYIINIQGDMPFIEISSIKDIVTNLKNSDYDIVTSGVNVDYDIAKHTSNVKIIADKNNKALYFSRSLIPYGSKEFLYHVGIYGFKKEALKKYVNIQQTKYEKSENLEQLRAIETGMNIGICISKEIPISVDTQEDLEKARNLYKTII